MNELARAALRFPESAAGHVALAALMLAIAGVAAVILVSKFSRDPR